MDYFIYRKVNPNLAFSQIEIGCNISYSCVTCFQLTYLLWNNPRVMWNDSQEGNFQRIFEAILSDHQTDLTLRFSESNLVLHRGVLEPGTREIKQLHGHSVEGMIIAHYAAILNDYTMLSRFLDLEPRLLHMMCCMTKGKASLSENHRIGYGGRKIVSGTIGHEWGVITHSRGRTVEINLSLETDKQLSSILPSYVQAVRVTNVTLLHLAAKIGGGGVHVPTHLFKVIYKHNRETTLEIYILPNQTIPPDRRFSAYQYKGDMTNFIQRYSGILFNEWIRR